MRSQPNCFEVVLFGVGAVVDFNPILIWVGGANRLNFSFIVQCSRTDKDIDFKLFDFSYILFKFPPCLLPTWPPEK